MLKKIALLALIATTVQLNAAEDSFPSPSAPEEANVQDVQDVQEEAAELNTDQNRITVGLNYWLNESTVFKFAYGSTTSEFENVSETESSYVFQLAMGF